jgi:hypothetical protein
VFIKLRDVGLCYNPPEYIRVKLSSDLLIYNENYNFNLTGESGQPDQHILSLWKNSKRSQLLLEKPV